jgi:hypothetical protein
MRSKWYARQANIHTKLGGSDEGDVHTKRAMNAAAVEAKENPVWDGGPGRIRGLTVNAPARRGRERVFMCLGTVTVQLHTLCYPGVLEAA